MTATGELTALDLARWLVDETPDSPPCDGLDDDGCPMEAVARAWWDGSCDHIPEETLICAEHQDWVEGEQEAGRLLTCRRCRKFVRVRTGPLR